MENNLEIKTELDRLENNINDIFNSNDAAEYGRYSYTVEQQMLSAIKVTGDKIENAINDGTVIKRPFYYDDCFKVVIYFCEKIKEQMEENESEHMKSTKNALLYLCNNMLFDDNTERIQKIMNRYTESLSEIGIDNDIFKNYDHSLNNIK